MHRGSDGRMLKNALDLSSSAFPSENISRQISSFAATVISNDQEEHCAHLRRGQDVAPNPSLSAVAASLRSRSECDKRYFQPLSRPFRVCTPDRLEAEGLKERIRKRD
jgi:hypothetical protein